MVREVRVGDSAPGAAALSAILRGDMNGLRDAVNDNYMAVNDELPESEPPGLGEDPRATV